MKKFLVLVAVLFIGGCSTKFAYNNINWLIYWYIDDYIDLTNEQEEVFDEKLAQWLTWHKQDEMPKYIAHFDELINDIETQNISIDRMEYHRIKAREHWTRFRSHIVPDIAEMAPMLTDEQVVYLFAALEEDNTEEMEEFEERQQKSEKAKRQRWIKRNQDGLEDWLGKLTSEQDSFVENSYGKGESTRDYWLEYKQEYQSALRRLFVNRKDNPNFTSELKEMLSNPEAYRSDEFNAASQRNTMHTQEFLLTIFTLSTEKQREELIDQISEYRQDIADLAKQ